MASTHKVRGQKKLSDSHILVTEIKSSEGQHLHSSDTKLPKYTYIIIIIIISTRINTVSVIFVLCSSPLMFRLATRTSKHVQISVLLPLFR